MKTWLACFAAILPVVLGAAAPRDLTVPLQSYQTRQLTIEAEVGGRLRTFLFDTGEGVTMITPRLAAELGCQPWGQVTAFRMLGERLDLKRCDDVAFAIGGERFKAPTVIVYDLAEIAGKDAPPLDGAVGLDLFAGRIITIQWAARHIVVGGANARAIPRGIEVPLRVARSAEGAALDVNLGVQTPRGLAWMELDSGNSGPTIFVSPAMAPLFGLKPDTRDPQPVQARLARGVTIDGKARVFPGMIMDGNIGTQLLDKWDITLDLKNGRAWLNPSRKEVASTERGRPR